MKALVTGASGFIGKHLVRALTDRNNEVRCLVRQSSAVAELQTMGVELAYGDIVDPDSVKAAVAAVDVVYHLAGLTAAFRRSELMTVNGDGTAAIAHAAAGQSTRPVLVVVSSLAAAGPAANGVFRSETDPVAPVSNYGRSKRAGEIAAQRHADLVPTTIIRPGMVFGGGDRMTLPMFATIARFGVHAVAGRRSPQISLLHVEDLVKLILRAADAGGRIAGPSATQSSQEHGYYFACCDEYPNYEQLGEMIAESLDRGVLVVRVPQPLPWLVAGVNQLAARLRGRPDGLNIDKIREATSASWLCSNEKARRELGFQPAKSLAERLRETAEWYREQGWL